LIKRTVESLVGAKRVIIHLYNSTSPAQRRIVFGLEKGDVVALAVQGTKWVKEHAEKTLQGTEVQLQYSPESFSATEVDFSLEVCEAVMDVWKPTMDRKIILNLPNTVEVAMPNVYADQVEWFCRHMTRRECATICLHSHNDRGTGIAATELGILAGADRVEGTLFGNGERTGNTDIVAVALNLYTQGIDPRLDFSNLESISEVYESCTGMKVPPRQPYSGGLVLTAFSGSHQDAIRKGLKARKEKMTSGGDAFWDVPYLAIDPEDLGREYKGVVIRVNGQSGKGGVAHLLESEYGIRLPKELEREFGAIAGKQIDALGREVTAEDLRGMFWKEYVDRGDHYELVGFQTSNNEHGECHCESVVMFADQKVNLKGDGNGPIAGFVHSLQSWGVKAKVIDQTQHALGEGEDALAIAYIKLELPSGKVRWGAGVDTNIDLASVKAILSALNRD
jgi:2-isopropylmalate synthase